MFYDIFTNSRITLEATSVLSGQNQAYINDLNTYIGSLPPDLPITLPPLPPSPAVVISRETKDLATNLSTQIATTQTDAKRGPSKPVQIIKPEDPKSFPSLTKIPQIVYSIVNNHLPVKLLKSLLSHPLIFAASLAYMTWYNRPGLPKEILDSYTALQTGSQHNPDISLKPGDGLDKIKAAFKACALKFHPDRNREKAASELDTITEIFRKCTESKDYLTKHLST